MAYQERLRLHLDEAASDVVGSIEERHRNGRTYLYDKFRIGTEMKRFAIHKLIVADRRHGGSDRAKAHKDRGQAAFLVSILA